MPTDPAAPPLLVTAAVAMQAPSFVPGSVVSAIITLSAKPQRPSNLVASRSDPRPRPLASTLAHSISATASSLRANFSSSATARVDYVVAELSARWSSDRTWLGPNVHPPVNPSLHLDDHMQAPHASSHTLPPDAFLMQSPRSLSSNPKPDAPDGPYQWSAALADANSVGGGGRPGHSGTIFRSRPIVVCEREQIPANSQVSFAVDAVLPDTVPPSFRGSAMRYGYTLIVVVKFPEAPVPHVVRVPFRVLPHATLASDPSIIPIPTPRGVGPLHNRFLQTNPIAPLQMSSRLLKSAPPDDIEIALALSMNGRLTDYRPDGPVQSDGHYASMSTTSGAPPFSAAATSPVGTLPTELSSFPEEPVQSRPDPLRVFAIAHSDSPVAKLYVGKRVHNLGDTIDILFEFDGVRPCYRINARLEMHEVVRSRRDTVEEALGNSARSSGGLFGSTSATAMAVAPGSDSLIVEEHENKDRGASAADTEQDSVVFRKVFGDYGEFTMAACNTQVVFSIPHESPASFSSGVVSVRWMVHFEFIVPRNQKRTSGARKQEKAQEKAQESDEDGAVEEERQLVEKIELANGDDEEQVEEGDEGWKGGDWFGEDESTWTHLPDVDVDVLRWTLPIVVSGRADSPWGQRNVNTITHVCPG